MTIALLVLAAAMGSTAAPSAAARPDAIPAFEALLHERVSLRPELEGRHPRLFFGSTELEQLRRKSADQPEMWREFLKKSWALNADPPAPPAQERAVHYRVGFALPEAAFAYALTRDARHLEIALKWIDAALAYEPWGYTYSKPNQDIPAGFLLYGLSFAYDLLHDDLPAAERDRVRDKIGEKAGLLYEPYRYKPGKKYTFSQNHTYINAAALGFAGLVLQGENPSANEWLSLARAVFDRTVRTYSPDGYYYEGYHYFEFSVPWIVHFLDAMEFNTNEKWYERVRLDLAKFYVAHSVVPGGLVFDIGDNGRGATDRSEGKTEIHGAHNILYRLATRYRDPMAATVADWVSREVTSLESEPLWTFVWREKGDRPRLETLPLLYRFENADAVFYRTSWAKGATAFAMRCGPPEGHRAAALIPLIPEWRPNMGHVHPDNGAFIIIAGGRYLTGDAGYTGVKMTEHHNTILIDGHGQENDGRHEVFRDVPYDRLNQIHVVEAKQEGRQVQVVCDAVAAYPPELKARRWLRALRYDGDRTFTIADQLELDRPVATAFLFHADRSIEKKEADTFVLQGVTGTTELKVQMPAALASAIDPQWVIAQGRPGSVENGEREQRGMRLTLTAPPAQKTRFQAVLRVNPEATRSSTDPRIPRGDEGVVR